MNLLGYIKFYGCCECILLPVCNSQNSCRKAILTKIKLGVVRKLAKNSTQKEIDEAIRFLVRWHGVLRTDHKKVFLYLVPLASQEVRDEYLEKWYLLYLDLDLVKQFLQSGRVSSTAVEKCATELAEHVEMHLSCRKEWRKTAEAATQMIRLLLDYGYQFSLSKRLTKALLSFVTQLGWTDTTEIFLEKFAKKKEKQTKRR